MRLQTTTLLIVSTFMICAFSIVRPVPAQSLSLVPHELRLKDSLGNDTTAITRARIVLGRASGSDGLIRIYGIDGDEVLRADAGRDEVTMTGDIFILPNGSVGSSIRLEGDSANIELGGQGQDGDLVLTTSAGVDSIELDGETGTAQNSLAGDGYVKAWARVDTDGTVLSCYRCDPSKTSRTATGVYEVDFSLLAADITSRPRMAVGDGFSAGAGSLHVVRMADHASDTAKIQILTFRLFTTGPAADDDSFTVTVF